MVAMIKAGLLVGAGLLAYNIFAKGNALKQLNFYPSSVEGVQFNGVTPVLSIILGIQNTSNQAMTINSLAGNVFANGYLIGNISSFRAAEILPNAETNILLNIRLSLIGVVEDIIRAIKGDGISQEVNFKATANVDHYQIPIDINYKIGS